MLNRHGFALAAVLLLVVTGMATAEIDPTTGLPPKSSAFVPLPHGLGTNVLWDLTHGVFLSYEPSGLYSDLVTLLAANGFNVTTTAAGINNIDLSPYEVLVICLGSNWDSPYTAPEVAAVQAFIGAGKGVLVMGDNTDTPNGNINPITQAFGTTCGISYLQPPDLFFSNFIVHPIFTGVGSIYYRAGGELDGVAPSVEAAFTTEGYPTITVLDPCGMVVTGDINFCDNVYFANADNRLFALNVFRWLAGGCATPVENTTWGALKAFYR